MKTYPTDREIFFREALARYGRHDKTCPLYGEPNLPGDERCTCRFSEALKRMEPDTPTPLDEQPMPWCVECQCYHHETAPHISRVAHDYGKQRERNLVLLEAMEGLINFIAAPKPDDAARNKALRGLIKLRGELEVFYPFTPLPIKKGGS